MSDLEKDYRKIQIINIIAAILSFISIAVNIYSCGMKNGEHKVYEKYKQESENK